MFAKEEKGTHRSYHFNTKSMTGLSQSVSMDSRGYVDIKKKPIIKQFWKFGKCSDNITQFSFLNNFFDFKVYLF